MTKQGWGIGQKKSIKIPKRYKTFISRYFMSKNFRFESERDFKKELNETIRQLSNGSI